MPSLLCVRYVYINFVLYTQIVLQYTENSVIQIFLGKQSTIVTDKDCAFLIIIKIRPFNLGYFIYYLIILCIVLFTLLRT